LVNDAIINDAVIQSLESRTCSNKKVIECQNCQDHLEGETLIIVIVVIVVIVICKCSWKQWWNGYPMEVVGNN